MIYPVILQLRLLTTNEVGERDEICFEGRAMAALREDGTWSVRYTDAENHGQTALQGSNSWVSVSRDGDTKSRLLFRVGERLESVYVTPQGEFDMATQTTHIDQQIQADFSEVTVEYDLFLSGKRVTTNTLTLTWAPLPTK